MYSDMYIRYEELRKKFGLSKAKEMIKDEYNLTNLEYLRLISEAEELD